MEIVEEKLVSKPEVLKLLKERIKKKDAISIQTFTYEVLKESSKEIKNVEEIKQKLKELKLREKDIVAILDVLPKDRDDLRVIFEKEYVTLSEDTINKILEITNSL